MAHLSPAEVEARRQAISENILGCWAATPGFDLYFILCPCLIDCQCVPVDESPRLVLNNCYYVGELDWFTIYQPFAEKYGFDVTWHCSEEECRSELACGLPTHL